MSKIPDLQPSELITKLVDEKKIARAFQERRHEDWNDNYELYRNRVKTNRLTQRQAANIPLMKETVKTLLSKVDDPPTVDWEDLGGNEMKEMMVQETWNEDYREGNFEGLDIQDKKTNLMSGRSFKKLNWTQGKFELRSPDIFDIVLDPLVDPLNIETARFIVHQNIFRPIRDVLADKRYKASAKKKLLTYLSSQAGIIQSGKTKEEFDKKMERLQAMGVKSSDFPLFGAGDRLVNLSEHITHLWDSQQEKFVRYVVVYADDMIELMNEPLTKVLGVDFYPYTTWGEDVETNDFWSDGPADLVRVPNKILNVWFSQMVENRTLRNMGMFWYDATIQGYQPTTYEPGPGKMLPAPGDPNKTIMPVNINGLDETMTAIDFLIRIVERGTAATSIEKGVSEKKQITLGEVQMLVGKAMERTVSMAKFYRRSWEELATKWYALLVANQRGSRTLYRKSRDGRLWPKTAILGDLKSERGFRPLVRSTSEQEEEKTKGIQRFMFIKAQFPNNLALNKIIQKRMLEMVDLTPEEMREVETAEKQAQAMMQPAQSTQPTQPIQPAAPALTPALAQALVK